METTKSNFLEVLAKAFGAPSEELVDKFHKLQDRFGAHIDAMSANFPQCRPDRPSIPETSPLEKPSPFFEALVTPSRGFEPLLMEAGTGQIAARGLAKLAVRHGNPE